MKTEGRNAVIELLKTGKNVDKLLLEKGAQGSISMIFAEARKKNIRVQFVDKQVLDKESETKRHQGVIALPPIMNISIWTILSKTRKAKRAVLSCFATGLRTCITSAVFCVWRNAQVRTA